MPDTTIVDAVTTVGTSDTGAIAGHVDQGRADRRHKFTLARIASIDRAWLVDVAFADIVLTDLEAGSCFVDDPADASKVMQYAVTDGVAELALEGVMTKKPSCWSSMDCGTSTAALAQAIRAAGNDPRVKAIALKVDSPGGQVSGTPELADEVASAAAKKPVYAYADDMMASAAYWVAAQATKIYANRTASIGSIGALMTITDASKAAEQRGYKVHVISSGPMKGVGVNGAPITEPQIAKLQEYVNTIAGHFESAIVAGRRMSAEEVHTLATGDMWVGTDARDVGLIDGIMSYEAMLRMAKENAMSGTDHKGGMKMAFSPLDVVARIVHGMQAESGVGAGAGAGTGAGANEGGPTSVAATLPESSGNPELLRVVAAAGVASVEQFNTFAARAAVGDRYVGALRQYAVKQAIRLYGAEKGAIISAQCTAMQVSDLEAVVEAWETEADTKFGIGKDGIGGSRTSAAPALQTLTVPQSAEGSEPKAGAGAGGGGTGGAADGAIPSRKVLMGMTTLGTRATKLNGAGGGK